MEKEPTPKPKRKPLELKPITTMKIKNILMDCENRLKFYPPIEEGELPEAYEWRVSTWRRDVRKFIETCRMAIRQRDEAGEY